MIFRSMGKLVRDEDGPTAIEYALICSLIFLVIISAVVLVGGRLENTYNYVGNEVANATN